MSELGNIIENIELDAEIKKLKAEIQKLKEQLADAEMCLDAIYNIDAKYIESDYEHRYDIFYSDMCELVEEYKSKYKVGE